MRAKQAFGVILAVLGTLIAVGVSLYLTKEPNSLWGLVATAVVASDMVNWKPDEKSWAPIIIGFSILMVGLVIAGAVYITMLEPVLWALIICMLIADIGKRQVL